MKKAKLLWIDLEMTGLDPTKDKILEVAANTAHCKAHIYTCITVGNGEYVKVIDCFFIIFK